MNMNDLSKHPDPALEQFLRRDRLQRILDAKERPDQLVDFGQVLLGHAPQHAQQRNHVVSGQPVANVLAALAGNHQARLS